MKNSLLIFLLIAFFFKQLFWLALIPAWHFPDEEQHFSQVAFYAEKGRFPKGSDKDVNQEIDKSSEILGTKRDNRGINKYTYHPEYRFPYSKNQIGLYEDKIIALNTKKNRQTMVKHEAARYGPVYYFLSAIPYKIFYSSNLLIRLFSSRFISVILSTFTVLTVFFISKEIFKDKLLQFALTFLVAFQPMFSFVSAGVNSDNLFNLVFTLILYLSLKIFFNKKSDILLKENIFYFLLLIFCLIIGFYAKKQIYIAFPVIALAFFISFLNPKKKFSKQYFLIALLLVFSFLFLTKGRINIPEYAPNKPMKLNETFIQYIFWHFKHTIAETIPWYWGVFNWLGVTLPRWVNQIQSRLLIISAFGVIVYFFKQIKSKKIFFNKNLKIIFLFGSAAIYYLSIILWDYLFRSTHSFSFGIQGRYFFPTIVSHMSFILIGLLILIPQKLKAIFLKILLFWWFIFSLIGLKTAASSYYQLWPLEVFLNQASQYKPLIFKKIGLSVIGLAFLFSQLILLIFLIRINEAKNKQIN